MTCGSLQINTKSALKASNALDGAAADFSSGATRFEILTENFEYNDSRIGGRGITGEIDPVVAHLRNGQRLVTGGMVVEVGANELEYWINPILGSDEKKAERTWTAVPRDFMFQRDQATHQYRYCICNSARFSSQQAGEDPESQIMRVAMSWLGVEEIGGTFPAALELPAAPRLFWIHADTVATIDGTEYPVMQWAITIQNFIRPLFRNSMTPGCFRLLGRRVTLDIDIPADTTPVADLYTADFEGDISIEMTSDNLPASMSAYTTVFDLKNVRRLGKQLNAVNQEIPIRLRYQAYRDAATNPLEITNAVS